MNIPDSLQIWAASVKINNKNIGQYIVAFYSSMFRSTVVPILSQLINRLQLLIDQSNSKFNHILLLWRCLSSLENLNKMIKTYNLWIEWLKKSKSCCSRFFMGGKNYRILNVWKKHEFDIFYWSQYVSLNLFAHVIATNQSCSHKSVSYSVCQSFSF